MHKTDLRVMHVPIFGESICEKQVWKLSLDGMYKVYVILGTGGQPLVMTPAILLSLISSLFQVVPRDLIDD